MMLANRGRVSTNVGIVTGGSSCHSSNKRSKTPPPPTSRPSRSKSPTAAAATRQQRRSKTPPPSHRISSSSWEELFGMTHHVDNAAFEKAVRRCIPSTFTLIASQDDLTQAQEDWYAMDHYKFPCSTRARKINAGSVATCALLELLYENPQAVVATSNSSNNNNKPLTCLDVSREIKRRVKQASKLDAKPTISSSRPLAPKGGEYAPFYIVPPGGHTSGRRRALLIGVVSGEGPNLKGPPNDIENMQHFLQKHCDFQDITILLDQDPAYPQPTRKNILAAFERLVKVSQPNDVVVIQFTGHGGRQNNNLFLLPSDYHKHGPIMDELILKDLIKAMPPSVHTTMLVDCCYSGTVGDLPYVLKHNNKGTQEIEAYFDTDTRQEVLTKEVQGGKEYQQWKKARAERRVLSRSLVGAVADAVGQGLASAATTTSNAAVTGIRTSASAAGAAASGAAAGLRNAAATATASVASGAAAGLRSSANAAGAAAGTALRRTATSPMRMTRSGDSCTESKRSSGSERGRRTSPRRTSNESDNSNHKRRPSPRRISNDSDSGTRSSNGKVAASAFTALSNAASTASNAATSTLMNSASVATGALRRTATAPVGRPKKSLEEEALEFEEAARKAAVERSGREAANRRSSNDSNTSSSRQQSTATVGGVASSAFSALSNAATSASNAANAAATSAANAANAAASTASSTLVSSAAAVNDAATGAASTLRRTATSPMRSRSPIRRCNTTPDGGRPRPAARSTTPVRRNQTAPTDSSPRRSRSPIRRSNTTTTTSSAGTTTVTNTATQKRSLSPPRRKRSDEQKATEAEEKARRAAVERSRREAAEARQAVRQK